jgi:hypothetical protein
MISNTFIQMSLIFLVDPKKGIEKMNPEKMFLAKIPARLVD